MQAKKEDEHDIHSHRQKAEVVHKERAVAAPAALQQQTVTVDGAETAYLGCDCTDVAAERDAAIVDRDQAASELALYKLAFGDILPEPAHPVYAPNSGNTPTFTTFEDQYEHSYYEPESYINDDYSDIPYEHATVTSDYVPTDEELHFFDTDEYSPEEYYQGSTEIGGYLDYVLNSYNPEAEHYGDDHHGRQSGHQSRRGHGRHH